MGGPKMTKEVDAQVTCIHHLGIIWVTSHWIKVSEHVGISYVSNRLQGNYLKSANARSRRGPN